MVLSVETNFFKVSRFSQQSRPNFFFSVEIFKIETFQLRFLSRLSRFVETQSIFVEKSWHCWEISTLSRPFESENDEKSWRIEKSRWENAKIHALLDRDRDKLSRNAEIFRSRWISRSRLRLFGLDIDVETKSRSLDLDRDFLTVEAHFLTLSRFSQLLRRTLWRRRDWDSQSRHDRDKSRPPGLFYYHFKKKS